MVSIPLTVRLATEEDVPAIRQIMQEAFSYYAMRIGMEEKGAVQALGETCEDIAAQLATKRIYVAVVDGVVAGSVRLETLPDGSVYFSRFGVLQAYKGYKIGDHLMEAVDRYMLENGLGCLVLHTASCLLSLIRFYYAKGFAIESTDAPRGYARAKLCKHYAQSTMAYAASAL